ncbi:MAG: AzlC family ABC transporter permease [Gammaproteobacteria bacterium]|jgi:4-azaleucine resistance transporter AzlC|nr:AzlC family ABC transporter permease [Gammaproteobacteria bacterium]MBT3725376.1 AzlC family ABC transporter permease [Gammaproteobacteria bacterium]MBT4078605.1 AzlC family ABC transporter permease [Gammaproteobacteria bacterium]MBT4193690.1 AzlC family ABC transporter permease [Gammaproteobacteria bacterium]MBT4451012.1 AzlC family ABC transporter permease [Gammaproteobacteria bacterium]
MSKQGHNFYWQGAKAGFPFILVVGPFGLLFGVVATETGLDTIQTMAMTILVIAGASQFAAVQLLAENAPVLVVILTGLAVNMRMAMYSASIAPHIGKADTWQRILTAYFLVDQSYAVSILKYENSPELSVSEKLRYFFGTMIPIAPIWYISTYIGIVAGAEIPQKFALDFAIPITFLALVGPSLRSFPHLSAAIVSVVASLLLIWMPFNLWLIVAAFLAMMTGAYVEKQLETNYD